jgi:hypothetical protein
VPEVQRELRSTGHVRQAYGDGIGSDLVTGLFVTAQVVIEAAEAAADHGGAWITRAIKCLKSIRWMPWR